MTRRLIPTALAALLVAGCASDDGTGATTPTPAPEEATTTTETGEALTTDARVTELPNGRHLVFIQQVADDGSTLAIDLAIWFSGEEANAAAAEDGQTEIPVPNDYYIRNADPAIIEVPVSDDVAVTSVWFDYDTDPDLQSDPITYQLSVFAGNASHLGHSVLRHTPPESQLGVGGLRLPASLEPGTYG
ncbi:MAG: hypothetical protein ACRDXD_04830 [Acidimicrobiia bacterium]